MWLIHDKSFVIEDLSNKRTKTGSDCFVFQSNFEANLCQIKQMDSNPRPWVHEARLYRCATAVGLRCDEVQKKFKIKWKLFFLGCRNSKARLPLREQLQLVRVRNFQVSDAVDTDDVGHNAKRRFRHPQVFVLAASKNCRFKLWPTRGQFYKTFYDCNLRLFVIR